MFFVVKTTNSQDCSNRRFGIRLLEQLPPHGAGHPAVIMVNEAADAAEELDLYYIHGTPWLMARLNLNSEAEILKEMSLPPLFFLFHFRILY